MNAPAAAVQLDDRSRRYYTADRPEIAALIPADCRRVLDIGCGCGNLGAMLRARGHYVAGLELSPTMAAEARRRIDEVVCGDVETHSLPWDECSFDAVVCADVLEHVLDPWMATRRLSALLRPGGLLVVSVPNVQNHRVIAGLLRGRFEYASSGLLDRGHLRFFTASSLGRLFDAAGFDLVSRSGLWRRTKVRRALMALTLGRVEPFLVRQYLVVGRRRPTSHREAA